MIASLGARLILRIAVEMVRRLNVPASWLGFVALKDESVASCRKRGTFDSFDVVAPEMVCENPLPRNVRHVDELPKGRLWGKSFTDVPSKTVRATYIATVNQCFVVTYYDEWQNEFSIVVDGNFRLLPVRGLEFNGGRGLSLSGRHTQVLRAHRGGANLPTIAEVAWIFENWSANYYHWVVYHLPKALLLRQHFPSTKILLPAHNGLYPVIRESLRTLGYDDASLVVQPTDMICVESMRVIDGDQHDPRLLREVANCFLANRLDSGPSLIYISRSKAKWRRVVNEDELTGALVARGFAVLETESLSFAEQVHAMRFAKVILSPHGAGLTNMMFAPPGVDIVEIVNPSFPNPDYYALASALGHTYWFIEAAGADNVEQPSLEDLYVQIDSLMSLLDDVLAESNAVTAVPEQTPAESSIDVRTGEQIRFEQPTEFGR